MFVGKAGAYLSEAPLADTTSNFAIVTGALSSEQARLPRNGLSYKRIMTYRICPWLHKSPFFLIRLVEYLKMIIFGQHISSPEKKVF